MALAAAPVAEQAPQHEPLIRHQWEPPPEWVAQLRAISPVSAVHSWLAFRWFTEAQRWVLYECVPSDYIDPGIRSELAGPHPDAVPEWARIISRYQWEMYQQHRVHARPCWIIQGTHGGHLVQYDMADRELALAVGLPASPPQVGELPYAPFDTRVVRQLIKRNKLVAVKNDLARFKREFVGDAHKRWLRERLRAARAEYVAYLNDQFEEPAEDFVAAERAGELDDAPVSRTDWQQQDEQSTQRYIETGAF